MDGVTTDSCRLRPVEPGDVPIFFEHQADVAAAATAAVPSRRRADHDAHWERLLADPTVLVRTVVTREVPDGRSEEGSGGPAGDGAGGGAPEGDGRDAGREVVAGNVLTFLRDGHREVGYWLGRAFWGRGLATAALGQFLAILDERPLVAHVAVANGPSATVLLRNGFREVGTHRTEDGVELRGFTLP
jgi:RimJ/RimL family protein N-acetyltransferase